MVPHGNARTCAKTIEFGWRDSWKLGFLGRTSARSGFYLAPRTGFELEAFWLTALVVFSERNTSAEHSIFRVGRSRITVALPLWARAPPLHYLFADANLRRWDRWSAE